MSERKDPWLKTEEVCLVNDEAFIKEAAKEKLVIDPTSEPDDAAQMKYEEEVMTAKLLGMPTATNMTQEDKASAVKLGDDTIEWMRTGRWPS